MGNMEPQNEPGVLHPFWLARKLAQSAGAANVPATISAIVDAIWRAEQILIEISRRWPVK